MARINKLNVRQQKFVLGLFEGKSATQSYIDAGYRPNQGNSSRMKWYDSIQAELAKLQAEARKSSEITVESLMAELEDARSKATSLNQLSAAVRATGEKIKLSGLSVQKIEVSRPDFDKDMSIQEIVDKVVDEAGVEAAVALIKAFGMNPQDYGLDQANGNIARGGGKGREMRPPCSTAKSFGPPAVASTRPASTRPQLGYSQRAAEEAKPVNRKRQTG